MNGAKQQETLDAILQAQLRTNQLLESIGDQLAHVLQEQQDAFTASTDIVGTLRTQPDDGDEEGEAYLATIADGIKALVRASQ